jgi:aminoglycoside phosphotransferase (APT) family kinase protein
MGSSVFVVSATDGKRYAIKIGEDVGTDIKALELIDHCRVDIPVPKVYGYFDSPKGKVMIMENVEFSLLEDISDSEKVLYIRSMLEALEKLHLIRSAKAGTVGKDGAESWKEFLLSKFSGKHPWFDWEKISSRHGVDRELVEGGLGQISAGIRNAELPEGDYSLLHTDFNQRNLFVDPKTHRIAGIVDWSEAAFGDPLYDFARVHLFMLHFNSGETALAKYHDILGLSAEEKGREELYLKSIMLEYIAWYSEKSDEFNRGRLELHQEFLRSNL